MKCKDIFLWTQKDTSNGEDSSQLNRVYIYIYIYNHNNKNFNGGIYFRVGAVFLDEVDSNYCVFMGDRKMEVDPMDLDIHVSYNLTQLILKLYFMIWFLYWMEYQTSFVI